MKPGDIVQTFGDPINSTAPIGQARLVKQLQETVTLELWLVEYLDDEGHYYNQFIKKIEDGKGNERTQNTDQ